jgi:ubiquitin carboxyl-terminal hydrolase L3
MSPLPVLHATNQKWSNPIGLPSGPLSFQDLFSLDPEFLQFIPKPIKAVLLHFPCRGELAEARKKEEEDGEGKFTGDVWWIKQTVSLSYLYLS